MAGDRFGIEWSEDPTGQCSYGSVTVLAFRHAPQVPVSHGDDGDAASDDWACQRDDPYDPELTAILHESQEEFGETVLGTLAAFEWCPDDYTHELRVQEMRVPIIDVRKHNRLFADLIGANGRVIGGRSSAGQHSWIHPGYPGDSDHYHELRQRWRAPKGFEPVAFRVTIGSRSWRVAIEPPALSDQIEQRVRIAFRANPSGAGTEACLLLEDGARVCPARAAPQGGPDPAGWQRSGALTWHAALGPEYAPERPRCALTDDLGDLAWQVSTLGGHGSALYAGQRQFLTTSGLFSDEVPWGVISQGAIALPVARVATDARNGLALAEIVGPAPALGPHLHAPLAVSTAEAADGEPALVAYPWSEAGRFAMTRVRVTEVTDRLLRHNGWGWDRAGAPIVDPCSRQVLGISTGSNEALRAETVATALGELRRQRLPLQAPDQGPELHGSITLLPRPVYLSTTQPTFGGVVCNARPSTRYDIVYAVYLVSAASPNLASVVDGILTRPSLCIGTDKTFFVEYQSDQVPSHFCAEPWWPQSPRSTIDLALVAPPGTELLQATAFHREPCPGLSGYWATAWPSTHFVRLRFPQLAAFDDITVQIEDASGRRHDPTSSRYLDVDPDVLAWRFNLEEAEPVRVIVSIR